MLGSRIWLRAGMVVAGLMLMQYWLMAIMALQKGQVFAYKTWWNASMGAWTLLALLTFLTPFWIGWVWLHWNQKKGRNTPSQSSTSSPIQKNDVSGSEAPSDTHS